MVLLYQKTGEKSYFYNNIFYFQGATYAPKRLIPFDALIIYMYKIQLDGLVGHPKINENLDKDNFINMIVALGHDKEKAEIMYDCMKEIIALYNIPLSSALTCVIQEADLSAEEENVDELMDISSKLLEVLAKVFQSLTDVVMQKAKAGIERA